MQLYRSILWQSRMLVSGILLAVIVISCGRPARRTELPPYVMDKETIEKVLTDLHLIEAVLIRKQSQGLMAFDLAEIYYDSLFKKHGVSKQQFDSTIAFYSRNPGELDEIYKNVITNLSRLESEEGKSDGVPDTLTIN